MKVDTIIFDIGNVLVAYEWQEFLEREFPDPKTQEVLAKAIFQGPVWPQMDLGLLSEEEELEAMIAQAPAYEAQIRKAYENLGGCIRMYPETPAWLKELRDQGYRLFALSNWPRRVYELRGKHLDFLEDLDGYLLSFQVHQKKPEKDFYVRLLRTYGIQAEQAVFLDDTPENVEGAVRAGLHGIRYQSREQAREALKALGVK